MYIYGHIYGYIYMDTYIWIYMDIECMYNTYIGYRRPYKTSTMHIYGHIYEYIRTHVGTYI